MQKFKRNTKVKVTAKFIDGELTGVVDWAYRNGSGDYEYILRDMKHPKINDKKSQMSQMKDIFFKENWLSEI